MLTDGGTARASRHGADQSARTDEGDLTKYFELFTSALLRVLWERLEALGRVREAPRSDPRGFAVAPQKLRTTWSAGTNFAVNRDELIQFLRAQPWASEATVTGLGDPQAAVIGVAVTDMLELVFDTLATSRKAANLRNNPRIALVVGWDEGQTAQIEGVADEPVGAELQAAKDAYLRRFPDGHERAALPDITYFRIVPRWIRYSDFRATPPTIVVFEGDLRQPDVEGASR
jgi:general stress protein 26